MRPVRRTVVSAEKALEWIGVGTNLCTIHLKAPEAVKHVLRSNMPRADPARAVRAQPNYIPAPQSDNKSSCIEDTHVLTSLAYTCTHAYPVTYVSVHPNSEGDIEEDAPKYMNPSVCIPIPL